MTFVTRVAKKTCDSQRMGKREAVTEIGAMIQPVASGRGSGGPPRLDAEPENAPTLQGMGSLEDVHAPCWASSSVYQPPGVDKSIRSDQGAGLCSKEWSTRDMRPRIILSLSWPVSLLGSPMQQWSNCVNPAGL